LPAGSVAGHFREYAEGEKTAGKAVVVKRESAMVTPKGGAINEASTTAAAKWLNSEEE
jgi:hypothetical protein